MTAWLSWFGGVAFLGAIIAVHWIYFKVHFFADGRLAIRLPLTLDPGVKHFVLLPAAQRRLHGGANAGLLPANATAMADEASGTANGDATAAANDFELSSFTRLQPKNVLIPSSHLLVRWPSSPGGAGAPPASPLSAASDRSGWIADRVIVDDRYLVLDGIVTETELVCWGDVEIRADSVIGACLKVRGNMYVGANVTFLGSVVVNGGISTGENCVFLFDVVSKGGMIAGRGARFGRPTGELAIPVLRQRLADQQGLAEIALSDLQYEMHYE